MKRRFIYFLNATMLLFCSLVVSADDTNNVYLTPLSYTVSPGDSFTVDVLCIPIQPIKAFEFSLDFDKSLLKANYVVEGDIFDGFNTFFNDGTIDNNKGEIKDVFSLIMGQGNVSESGSLVSISFTATQNVGTTLLDLFGVGLTDEHDYLLVDVSDSSITVKVSGGGSGGGYNPPPPFVPPVEDENNPPEQPMIPTGPVFVETGVEYEYSSSSFDMDGDLIRYRFDWGDGNLSNWTEQVESNVSVNLSYIWNDVSTYEIKIIAQDELGKNSTWSSPLNVTVSQAMGEGEPPVIDIDIEEDLIVNKTFLFDASSCYDTDGFIVAYLWDFGDGNTSSEPSTYHVFKKPGIYIVSLTLTDNNGNVIRKNMSVNVASLVEEEIDNVVVFPYYFGFILFGILTAVLILVFFRDEIQLRLTNHSFSYSGSTLHRNRILKIEAKIKQLKR